MKKILIVLAVLFLLLLGAAIAFPYFFKDEIITAVKEEANNNINATVDFSDVDISLLKDFPNVSFGMNDLKVTGKDDFEGINLISAKNFNLALDFWSVWNGGNPLKINGINVDKPEVNVFVLENGKANYDITKPTESAAETEESADFLINLDEYSITDGKIHFDDRTMNLLLDVQGLNHSGSGNFTAEVYDLSTETSTEKMTVKMDGISYLNGVKTNLDAIFNMDMKNMKFTLKDNDLRINALQLLADGWLKLNEENMDMDFKFNTPSGKFKDFLSLIPGAYTSGFEGVKANGNFAFDATVKGKFDSAKEIMPAFRVKLDLDKADFKYPDLPVGISGIFANIDINSPSSNLDKMTVKVPKFSMRVGNNPIEGFFNLKTPMSDPNLDMKMKGKLDLEQLAKAMPMEGVDKITGLIDADVKMKARMSQIDKGDYESVDASGYFNIVNLDYRAADMPTVKVKKMSTSLSPKKLTVNNLDAKLGKSDLKGNMTIDNLLAYFSKDKTMKGEMYIRSKNLDANEWMTEEETAAAPDAEAPATEVFDRFDFKMDAQADVIHYEDKKMLNTIAKGRMTSNEFDLENFSTKIGKSDIKASGEVRNAFDYLFKNETLRGEIDLAGKMLDLNELMGEAPPESAGEEAPLTEPILVPEKVDMTINADLGRVIYDNMDLRDLRGALSVKDEAVTMKNVRMKGLGGNMNFNGNYTSKDTKEPKFAFEYDLAKLDFKQAFNTFNSFEKLAPAAKFISGNFTSTLKMDGSLGTDMTPNLKSLNANGFLETLNGLISGFKPLNKVSNLLGVNELKEGKLSELKTKFKISDGKVTVQEFPVKLAGLDMKVGGSHGLEQDMDYKLKMKIPRKLLEKSGVTSAANKGIGLLSSEAKKLGMNIDAGEFINVMINLTGTVSDPKTSLKLLGTEGEALTVDNVINTATEEVKEQIEDVKTEIKEEIDDTKANLKAQADAEIAKLMKEAKSTSDKIRKEGYAAAETLRKEGYKQADDLIKKAGSNPFKKEAAKIAAKKLKKETDKKADKLKVESDKKADSVLTKAEQKSEQIRKKYENQ